MIKLQDKDINFNENIVNNFYTKMHHDKINQMKKFWEKVFILIRDNSQYKLVIKLSNLLKKIMKECKDWLSFNHNINSIKKNYEWSNHS